MADVFTANARMIGGGQIRDTVTGQNQPFSFARNLIAARARTFTHGTGNNQANKIHLAQYTLTTGTQNNHDFAGGLTDYKGAAITFTAVKWVYVQIQSPDGTKALRIGPQNVANAGSFWWGGAGATVYHTTKTDFEYYEPLAGATVTGGSADLFPINNQTAVTVIYTLLVVGVG